MHLVIGIALVAGAYAAGAAPRGVIFGKRSMGADLRQRGSGATGATNALRLLGWRISLAVLALDFAKGLLPVLLGRALGVSWWMIAATGVAAVLGHCCSPFTGFKGGKGVTTGAGAAAGLAPWVLLILPVMVAMVALTRYMARRVWHRLPSGVRRCPGWRHPLADLCHDPRRDRRRRPPPPGQHLAPDQRDRAASRHSDLIPTAPNSQSSRRPFFRLSARPRAHLLQLLRHCEQGPL